MRGDQLARQWRVIRAVEASPNGLTVAEIAIFPYPFRFKTPLPFTLTEFMSFYFYRDPDCKALDQALPGYSLGHRGLSI